MATTSPDNIRTPDPGDPFNLVPDLATLANDVQDALNTRGNLYRGTVSERTAFSASALPGMLWQDTDSIGMLWKRSASAWVPAVWRWSGTTAQMNSFGANAPDGFSWFNSTTGTEYIRAGGSWTGGWTPVALNSPYTGDAEWKRVGNQVTFRASVDQSLSAGTAIQLLTVPSAIAPNARQWAITASGGAIRPVSSYIDTGGIIRIRVGDTATQPILSGFWEIG